MIKGTTAIIAYFFYFIHLFDVRCRAKRQLRKPLIRFSVTYFFFCDDPLVSSLIMPLAILTGSTHFWPHLHVNINCVKLFQQRCYFLSLRQSRNNEWWMSPRNNEIRRRPSTRLFQHLIAPLIHERVSNLVFPKWTLGVRLMSLTTTKRLCTWASCKFKNNRSIKAYSSSS